MWRTLERRSNIITWAVFCSTVAACFFVLLTRFAVESNLWAFLPTAGDSPEQKFTRGLLAGELSRSFILAVEPEPTDCLNQSNCSADQSTAARRVAGLLAQSLRTHPAIAEVSSGPAPGFEAAIHDLYFPRRFALAPPAAREPYSKEYIEERVAQLKVFLTSPKSALYRSQLVDDPLLFFPSRIEGLARLKPSGVDVQDGQFVTPSGLALVFCSAKSGLTGDEKTSLHAYIQGEFRKLSGADSTVRLLMSGALPFEVNGEAKSKWDMERVGAISLFMAVGLTMILFRSVSALFAVMLPVALAYLVGCVCTLLIFGEVHVLTLAFGASLIGVSIDYPSHLLNEAALHQSSLVAAARRARPGLLVGCFTTVLGFFAFGLTSAQALLQVGVFAISGLLAALVATLYVLPLLPIQYGPGNVQRRIAADLQRRLVGLRRRARWISSGMALSLLGSGLAVWFAHYQVHPQALDPSPPDMKRDDRYVRAQLGLSEDMLVTSAPTLEEALEDSALLARDLEHRKRDGEITDYRSISALYLPERQQIENRRRAALPETAGHLEDALVAADFDPVAFTATPLGKRVASDSPLLNFHELLASPLGDLARPFFIQTKSGASVITQVTASPTQIQDVLHQHPEIVHYQPEVFLARSFTQLTKDIKLALLGAVGLVLLLVFLRHRRLRPTLAAFLPAALGAFVTLFIVGSWEPLHMFHLLSAISVLSMGVDYGTFMVETHEREGSPDAWPSALSAALSTLISFGCLGLSDVPALRAIGIVIGLGTLISIVATPLSFTLLTPSLRHEQRAQS